MNGETRYINVQLGFQHEINIETRNGSNPFHQRALELENGGSSKSIGGVHLESKGLTGEQGMEHRHVCSFATEMGEKDIRLRHRHTEDRLRSCTGYRRVPILPEFYL